MEGMIEFRAGVPQDYFVRQRFILKYLEINGSNLDSRDVRVKEIDGIKHYSLVDIYTKCSDLIIDKMVMRRAGEDGSIEDIERLKHEKLKEDVRKLKIANDFKQGSLVEATRAVETFQNNLSPIISILGGVHYRCKIRDPNLSQQSIAIIEEEVSAARNKAVDLIEMSIALLDG